MADQSLHSPTNPHFFKPLLPGFHTDLKVLVTFFAKHIAGTNNELFQTAKLRTYASDNTWLVKVDGLKLTDGWKDFAAAHDLKIGDIIIFRHEGDMAFHVTPFGPSFCDIQYTSASAQDINDDGHDQTTNHTGGTSAMSSVNYDYCFLAEVTASNLETDKLFLPVEATSCSALNRECQEAILVNKKGESWKVSLRFSESGAKYYITKGWTEFCLDNIYEIGSHIGFNVVGDGKTTPLMCVIPPRKECFDILSKYKHLRRKSGDFASTSRMN